MCSILVSRYFVTQCRYYDKQIGFEPVSHDNRYLLYRYILTESSPSITSSPRVRIRGITRRPRAATRGAEEEEATAGRGAGRRRHPALCACARIDAFAALLPLFSNSSSSSRVDSRTGPDVVVNVQQQKKACGVTSVDLSVLLSKKDQ